MPLDRSSISGFLFNVSGLVALADIKTIAYRTVLTGTACYLDVLFLAPGIHCQQAASEINQGECPTTGALTSGYVFRIENQATVGYLQHIGKTGHLVRVNVAPPCPSRIWGNFFATGPIASAIYIYGMALTVTVAVLLGVIHDWWGLGVLGMLMLARLLNVVIIRRRSKMGWKGAPEPGASADLLILLSQDRWIRMQGQMDDVKAVTAGQWMRDETILESYGASIATLLVFSSAALTVNTSTIGGVLIAGLLFVSAALLGICNAVTPNMQMYHRIISEDLAKPAKFYSRRLELAKELIEESRREDWAIAMGLIHLPESNEPHKVLC